MTRRRRRYADRFTVGASHIHRYKSGEGWRNRHERRLSINLRNKAWLIEWCETNGWDIAITNEGHHWSFRRESVLVEWWPSSAKLVIGKRWNQGIHCHDYEQCLAVLKATNGNRKACVVAKKARRARA